MKSRGYPCLLALAAAVILLSATIAVSAEYEALQGVASTDTVFDFRIDDPEKALGHLNLIHTMIDDPNMAVNDSKPKIAIVFIGPSVKLVSKDKSGVGKDQQKQLDALAEKISSMNQDGFRFVVCMAAVHAFDVDPDSILPEVKKVENGWITVVGYQQQGYSLVADF